MGKTAVARTPAGVFEPGSMVRFTELENPRALREGEESFDGTVGVGVVTVGDDGVAQLSGAKVGVRYLAAGWWMGRRTPRALRARRRRWLRSR